MNLTTSNIKQTRTFCIKIKESSTEINRSGSKTCMTSKKELSGGNINGYQPLNSHWCSNSPGLASDKILLLSDESLLKAEDREKKTIHKIGSLNLLISRTKSITKLIICVFSFALKVFLPNSKVYVSEKPVLSNNLWSRLTRRLRSVRWSLLYKGQWRKKEIADSTSLSQLHIGLSVSWNLCLNFMLSQMTKSKSNSCNIFDSNRIMAIKKRIRRRPYEF